MNRLCIYFFWDKDGVVDDYIPFLLKSFKQHCSEICFVVNGFINDEGKEKIAPYIDKLLIHENEGLDVGAYKYAIEHYGFEALKNYDELLLTNYTYFGPIYPLSEMFDEMGKKECDWWGLFKWPCTAPVIYHHIPSFFNVYRKSLLQSPAFKEYWQTLKKVDSYATSVEYHEQRQTPFYDERGFKSAIWIENWKYKEHWSEHWPLACADKLLIDEKCPFVKRRNFFFYEYCFTYNDMMKRIIKHIEENTDYDINLIFDNIKRTQQFLTWNKKYKNIGRYKIIGKFHPSKTKRHNYRMKIKLATLSKEFVDMTEKAHC